MIKLIDFLGYRAQLIFYLFGIPYIYNLFSIFFLRALNLNYFYNNSKTLFFFFLYIVALSISILVNIFTTEARISFASSLFNVLNSLLIFYPLIFFSQLKRYLSDNLLIYFLAFIILSAGFYSFYTLSSFSFPALISYLFPISGTNIISASQEIIIYRLDFLYDFFPRLTFFASYPNASILILLSIFSLYIYFRVSKNTKISIVIFELFLLFLVVMSLSRASYISYVVAFLFPISVLFFSSFRRISIFSAGISLIVSVSLLSVVIGFIFSNETLELFNSGRSGSSDIRAQLYLNALQFQNLSEFLFGHGGKEFLENKAIKIGSHSTIIGAFFKAGILGLIPLLLFYFFLIKDYFRLLLHFTANPTYKEFVILKIAMFTILWTFFEDLDGYPLLCISIGFVIACINYANKNNEKTF